MKATYSYDLYSSWCTLDLEVYSSCLSAIWHQSFSFPYPVTTALLHKSLTLNFCVFILHRNGIPQCFFVLLHVEASPSLLPLTMWDNRWAQVFYYTNYCTLYVSDKIVPPVLYAIQFIFRKSARLKAVVIQRIKPPPETPALYLVVLFLIQCPDNTPRKPTHDGYWTKYLKSMWHF